MIKFTSDRVAIVMCLHHIKHWKKSHSTDFIRSYRYGYIHGRLDEINPFGQIEARLSRLMSKVIFGAKKDLPK